MSISSVAESRGHNRLWLTTRDAARLLAVTPRWVRGLARAEQLRYEQTRSGLFLFRECEVLLLVAQRAKRRGRRREELLATVRPQMVRAGVGPRQTRFTLLRAGK